MALHLNLAALAAIALLSTAAAARGMGGELPPATYCALAEDIGYRTGGFRAESFGCVARRQVSKAAQGGLANDVAFDVAVRPGAAHIDRVTVVANVNDRRQADAAASELARVALAVGRKLMGGIVPANMVATIQQAGDDGWTFEGWRVEVRTTRWPTGRGYDTRVTFAPAR